MRIYVTFLALSGLLVLATSCGEAAGKKLASSNSKTTQFLETAKTAVNNFGNALDSQAFVESTCGATGLPSVSFGTGAYYIDAFPCALKTDSKNFQTMQGIMSLYSGIMCAIEDQVSFNYAASETTHNVTIDSIDPCLSGLSFGTNGTFPVVVKEQSLTLANFSYKISIDFPNSGVGAEYLGKRMYVYLRENGSETGAKISMGSYVSAGNSHTNFTGLFLNLNSSTNTFWFDLYSSNKHHRGVMVSGVSDFSSITSFYGAHATSPSQVMSYYANMSTYKYQATPGSVCYPGGDCALAGAPSTDFADFSNNATVLTTRFVNNTDGVLTFTNALPTQFLP